MNLSDEIRKQIEKNKELKLAVGEINNHLSVLEGLTRKDIMEQVDEAYQKGYDAGIIASSFVDTSDEAYQRGLDYAWEAAKKIVLNPDEGGLSALELNEIFNCATIQQVFRKYTLSEVIAKLKACEEKQKADDEIKVGDEVFDIPTKTKGILLEPETEHLLATVIVPSLRWRTINIRHANLKKTGKHYDIEKILEGIKHD